MLVTRGFGIVGTGVIAAIHADAIAMLSETGLADARLVAVTDVATGPAAAFAAAHGCPAEPDLAALLARRDVDVVCVCVPSGLHAQIAIQAGVRQPGFRQHGDGIGMNRRDHSGAHDPETAGHGVTSIHAASTLRYCGSATSGASISGCQRFSHSTETQFW